MGSGGTAPPFMTSTLEDIQELNTGATFVNGRCNNVGTWKCTDRTVYLKAC
jgi:hypothetical protein